VAALARAWLEPAAGWMGEEARRSQDRYSVAREREATAVEEKATEEDEENGVNPAPSRPIYRGVHRIYLLWFLPLYKTPQRLYPEKFTRRLRQISRESSHIYDLNLCLGH
jgi:hypothetical protein